MTRALLIAAAIALAAPAAAAANWTPADLDRSAAIADAHWPGSPCQGQVTIEQIRLAEMPWLASIAGTLTREGECGVSIVPENIATATILCGVLVHEFGHAAGLHHSEDPADVMYRELVVAPECVAAFSPPAPRVQFKRMSRRHRTLLQAAKRWRR